MKHNDKVEIEESPAPARDAIATSRRAPDNIVLLVIANVDFAGNTTYSQFFYYSSLPAKGPVLARPGDRIAWYVRIALNNQSVILPYTLTFSNPSFFGTASLTAPLGGGSGFLTISPSSGPISVKYTLSINGLTPLYDPDVQSDPNALLLQVAFSRKDHFLLTAIGTDSYAVVCRVDTTGVGTLSCTKNGSPANFPLSVKPGDVFVFQAAATSAIQSFSISFQQDPPRLWFSPFIEDKLNFTFSGTVAAGGLTASTTSLHVGDVFASDGNINFVFNAIVVLASGHKVTSNPGGLSVRQIQ